MCISDVGQTKPSCCEGRLGLSGGKVGRTTAYQGEDHRLKPQQHQSQAVQPETKPEHSSKTKILNTRIKHQSLIGKLTQISWWCSAASISKTSLYWEAKININTLHDTASTWFWMSEPSVVLLDKWNKIKSTGTDQTSTASRITVESSE